MSDKIRLFVAEDHSFIIDAFKTRLGRETDLEFSGSARNLTELFERLNGKSDVLLFDNIVEGRDETAFLNAITKIAKDQKQIKVVVFSVSSNLNFAKKAMEAGASGYLSKSLNMDEICEAVRKVYKGRNVLDLSDDDDSDSEDEELKKLFTFRERQVICLLCKGFNNPDIADLLGKINKRPMSASTVETHRRNIRKKGQLFGITNDASLGYMVAKFDILDGSELSTDEDG